VVVDHHRLVGLFPAGCPTKETIEMITDGPKKIENWKLERLSPHPRQGQFFLDPTTQEVKELAADLQRNGQLQPVEALPDGTIVAGHKRLAAARLLGWAELTVWVRDDLADDPAAAERRLIEDNLNRRQLGPLELARCYRHLKLLEARRGAGGLSDSAKSDLRDAIGRRLGVSGRNLDRYLRVLDGTPPEVQAAVASKKLPVTVAERVAGLGKPVRERIAAEIRGGADPRKVVGPFLTKKSVQHRLPRDAKTAFIKSLERGLADLGGRVEQVHGITPEERKTLQRGRKLIERLQARAKKQPRTQPSFAASRDTGEEEEGAAEEAMEGLSD
jgi:ParB family chromosome partitioning protein